MRVNCEIMLENNNKIEFLKLLFQGIIACGIISYSFGFLVVNTYFFQFGFTSFGLFKTRYIAAGLNLIFLFLISSALAFSFISLRTQSNIERFKEYGYLLRLSIYIIGFLYARILLSIDKRSLFDLLLNKPPIITLLLFCLLIVFSYFLPFFVVLYIGKVKRWEREKRIHVGMFVGELFLVLVMVFSLSLVSLYLVLWVAAVALMLFLIVRLRSFHPQKRTEESTSHSPKRIDWIDILLLSSLFFSFVYFFSIFIYPNIKQSMGGGKPLRIQLLPKKEKMEGLQNVLKVNENGLSEDVELIDQTDKEYYLLIKPAKESDKKVVIELNKDNFEGVIYVSESKR